MISIDSPFVFFPCFYASFYIFKCFDCVFFCICSSVFSFYKNFFFQMLKDNDKVSSFKFRFICLIVELIRQIYSKWRWYGHCFDMIINSVHDFLHCNCYLKFKRFNWPCWLIWILIREWGSNTVSSVFNLKKEKVWIRLDLNNEVIMKGFLVQRPRIPSFELWKIF